MNDTRVKIDGAAITRIKDFGINRFHETKKLPDMSGDELKTLLLFQGLEDYLRSKGIEPQFVVDVNGGK